jgi:peptide/nickel transport system substrate-binding protein
VSTRDLPFYRDPAVILIDQLKSLYRRRARCRRYAAYFPKLRRKDFTVALNLQTSGPDPDPILICSGCGRA